MNPRIIVIAAAFALSWVLFALAAREVYDRLLPGVPDAGRWPIAALPWLLARANTGTRPWHNVTHAAVWTLAIAALLVPALVPVTMARLRTERIAAWLCLAALIAWAMVTTFSVQYEYVRLFKWPPTALGAVWFVVEPMLWAGGICVLGFIAGVLVRNKMGANRTT